MKKIAKILILIILISGSVYVVYDFNQTKHNAKNIVTNEGTASDSSSLFQDKVRIKTKAVDFKLKDLNGNEVSLRDFQGKKVFLNFFATWCTPCKAEMPEMEKLYQETKDSDLVIIAVDLGETKSDAEKFIKSNNYNFLVLSDANSTVGNKYNIAGIPTSYFIDKNGNISDKHVGGMNINLMKNYIDNIK